jgi:hypothetical protein
MREELLTKSQKIETATRSTLDLQQKTMQAYNHTKSYHQKIVAEYKALWEQKKTWRHSDNVTPRHFGFESTHPKPKGLMYIDQNGQEVMATPKDSLAIAKHLLDVYEDPAVVDKARYILAKALEHQSKADTSTRLGSDPHACRSSENKPDPRDDQSRTRSSKRRRQEARN